MRQNQKGIRHRRRHEPFVAGQPVRTIVGPHRVRGVRLHIAAALLFRHAHAKRCAAFVTGRPRASVIVPRQNARRPDGVYVAGVAKAGQRSIGHRHRADMAALGLGRHIEPRRPCPVPQPLFAIVGFPDRGMQPGRDRAPHQGMIGRVIDHIVDAIAVAVIALQFGQLGVGEAGNVTGLVTAPEGALLEQVLTHAIGEP